MLNRPTALALLAGTGASLLALSPVASGAAAASNDMPITAITLYRSGVGSFQREGKVDGDRTVSLRFETGQVNDILKSLVVVDLDGGQVGAVSYGSKEPLDRRLAGFEVNLSGAPSISGMFKVLRGAKVKLTSPDATIEGAILNVEDRKTVIPPSGGNPGHFDEPYVTVVTSNGVRAVAVSRISAFEFAEPALADELNRALAAIAEQRADRTKAVDLTFNGPAGKPRRVAAAYVHETPVWKTSYRLVMSDTDKPLIQGWAIVENTTDSDWENVRLSLASGRPVSFTMDLYEPLFVPRPSVPVPVPLALAGRMYETDVRRQESLAAKAASRQSMLGDAAAPAKAGMDEMDRANVSYSMAGASAAIGGAGSAEISRAMLNTSAAAAAEEKGGQFFYTVSAPVTVQRLRSAMLPILAAPIEARRVSIYNPADGLSNPMRGVSFKNTTDLHLMPGPVSVYDAGAYAGDAQIGHTSPGTPRLLAYAVDLDVNARFEQNGVDHVTKVVISEGQLRTSFRRVRESKYHLDNRDAKRDRLVVVEHARYDGFELKEPQKPSEETESTYRFEVPLGADKQAELKVTEELVTYSITAISNLDDETLIAYARDGKISPDVVTAIKKAAEMQREIGRTEKAIQALTAEENEITQDQGRVRENMGRIDRASDLYARYMKKFADQETRVEVITKEKKALNESIEQQRRVLADYLANLNVE